MTDETKTVEEYEAELKKLYSERIELEKEKLSALKAEKEKVEADAKAKADTETKETEAIELENRIAEKFGLEPKDKLDGDGNEGSAEENDAKKPYVELMDDYKKHYKSKRTGKTIGDGVEYGSREWLGENISA